MIVVIPVRSPGAGNSHINPYDYWSLGYSTLKEHMLNMLNPPLLEYHDGFSSEPIAGFVGGGIIGRTLERSTANNPYLFAALLALLGLECLIKTLTICL